MTEPMRALVVDDEEGIRFFLKETLGMLGHAVTTAQNGQEALDYLRDQRFDLIMLDLQLGSRVDGMKVLEAARWRWPDAIIIILTAHGSLETAVTAIREGVDGYLLKPVGPQEVRTAIREALERRAVIAASREPDPRDALMEKGPFIVDVGKHQVKVGGQPVELTNPELALLVHLIRNANRVVPHSELVAEVRQYQPEYPNEAREIIKWYIHRLRRKVEPDPAHPRYILNVRGAGYTLGE